MKKGEKWIKMNILETADYDPLGSVVEIQEVHNNFVVFEKGTCTGHRLFKNLYWPLKEGLTYYFVNNKWEEIFQALEDLRHENLLIWKATYSNAKSFLETTGILSEFSQSMAHVKYGVNEIIKKID